MEFRPWSFAHTLIPEEQAKETPGDHALDVPLLIEFPDHRRAAIALHEVTVE